MKACPKCKTRNEDSSQFCKKCGISLSPSSFKEKKETVMGERKKRIALVPIALFIIALILTGVGYWIIQDNTGANPRVSSQPKVKGRFDYSGQTVRMTDIQAKVENGKISVPLDVVMEKRMVRFEYEGPQGKIPLLSYITPTGRVVTAVSMCEPCRSTRFHIQEKNMVCNACFTEWQLETLKGISGGCLNYPPDVIPSTIEKNQLRIDETTVRQWKPRV